MQAMTPDMKAPPRAQRVHQVVIFLLLFLAALALCGATYQSLTQGNGPLVEGVGDDAAAFKQLQAMAPADLAQLQAREVAAFLKDPLDRATMKNLVLLHEAGPKKADGTEIYDIFSGFTKRNVSVQVGAINSDLAAKQPDKAFENLDSLLRAHPQLGKTIYPMLYPTLVDDKTVAALAKTLASKPAWRRDFMNELAEHDPESTISYKLFSNLRKLNAAIDDSEFKYLFANLIGKKQYDKAYFMWLDFLPTDQLADIKLIYDGGFDRTPHNQFFDWNIDPRPNAHIGIEKRKENAKDSILALEFFQDREEFYHVYQFLKLGPGPYAISFDAKAEQIDMPAGLRWRLRCAADSTVLGESEKFVASQPWTTQTFTVSIPEEGCDTQILRLESVSRAKLDLKFDGQLYFDNFKIEKRDSPQGAAEGEAVTP